MKIIKRTNHCASIFIRGHCPVPVNHHWSIFKQLSLQRMAHNRFFRSTHDRSFNKNTLLLDPAIKPVNPSDVWNELCEIFLYDGTIICGLVRKRRAHVKPVGSLSFDWDIFDCWLLEMVERHEKLGCKACLLADGQGGFDGVALNFIDLAGKVL